ncbi:MAG TPA: CDP-diacylglycerol--serine O-phosphatidyltransferase [Polyangiaceae bacterium]
MSRARSKRSPGRARPRLDLRKTLFVLPNLITLGAVFCGFNAIRLVAKEQPTDDDVYRAAVLLIFAMLFDLMDGRVARMTKTQSAFGLQLDSLADVISFGVAPALLVYKWVLYREPIPGLLVAFGYVACAAIRLARFNVLASNASGTPTKPSKYIVGLPSPPAAGILISLAVANHAAGGVIGRVEYTWVLLCVTVGLGLLMVSNVTFRSFKDLRLDTGTIVLALFVLASSAFVWQKFRPEFVLVWLLGVYLLVGIVESIRGLAQKLRRRERRSIPPTNVE